MLTMASQTTQAEEASPAGYPFIEAPHPAAPEAPAPVTADDMARMQAAGDFEGIARAISAGLFTAPPLPDRTQPPAPVSSAPQVQPASDTPAEIETAATPADPWAPSVEQCSQDFCTLADAAAICSGIDPLRLRRAQMERELIRVPDAEIEALQARVTAARKVLESDDVFPNVVQDPARVLKIERDALAAFRKQLPHKRPNPDEFKRFRYAQPCSLRLCASQLLLAGLPVHARIVNSADDVDSLPGADYTEGATQFRAYGGIEEHEREALAAPDVSITLQDACIFALGGSAMTRREISQRLTVASMAPPLQPAERAALAILGSAAQDDEELIAEAVAAAVQMAPEFLPGLLADEQRIERGARAANNYARMLTSPDRRQPEYVYPVGERARRVLDAEALRRFFAHVAGLQGWCPPQLGAVPDTRSKFNASPALELWMRMGANPTDFAAAAGGIR